MGDLLIRRKIVTKTWWFLTGALSLVILLLMTHQKISLQVEHSVLINYQTSYGGND